MLHKTYNYIFLYYRPIEVKQENKYNDCLWCLFFVIDDSGPTVIGLKGEQGLPGFPGASGDPGIPGLPGKDGVAGAKGSRGDSGLYGAEGNWLICS